MNHAKAINKVQELAEKKVIPVDLESSILIKADDRKVAIIGRACEEKSFLINMLLGMPFYDKDSYDKIDVPVIFGKNPTHDKLWGQQNIDIQLSSLGNKYSDWEELANAMLAGGFFQQPRQKDYGINLLFKAVKPTSKEYWNYQNGVRGIEITNPQMLLPQNSWLLDNPKLINWSSSNDDDVFKKRIIRNIIDVSDIIVLLIDETRFTCEDFSLLMENSDVMNGKHKTVVLIVIHRVKNTYFPYPVDIDPQGESILARFMKRKANYQEELSGLTPGVDIGSINALIDLGINASVEHAVKLEERLTGLVTEKWFPVQKTFYFPVNTQDTHHDISEPQDVVRKVSEKKLLSICEWLCNACANTPNLPKKCEYVHWEEFLSKTEISFLDYMIPVWNEWQREYTKNIALRAIYKKEDIDFRRDLSRALTGFRYDNKLADAVLEEAVKKLRSKHFIASATSEEVKQDLSKILLPEWESAVSRISNIVVSRFKIEITNEVDSIISDIQSKILNTENSPNTVAKDIKSKLIECLSLDKLLKNLEKQSIYEARYLKLQREQGFLDKQRMSWIELHALILEIANEVNLSEMVEATLAKKNELEGFKPIAVEC